MTEVLAEKRIAFTGVCPRSRPIDVAVGKARDINISEGVCRYAMAPVRTTGPKLLSPGERAATIVTGMSIVKYIHPNRNSWVMFNRRHERDLLLGLDKRGPPPYTFALRIDPIGRGARADAKSEGERDSRNL